MKKLEKYGIIFLYDRSENMIAVQTNEYLHIVDMEVSEFLESVAKDGMNSSLIHAKTASYVSNNKYLYTINSVVPEIKWRFCQVGDQFQIDFKPVSSIDDLRFFIAPDGKQYANEAAYHFALEKGEVKREESVPLHPEVPKPEAANPVPNPEVAAPVLNPEIPSPEVEAGAPAPEEESTEEPAQEEETEEDERESEEVIAPSEEAPAIPNPEEPQEEEEEEKIPVTEEQRKVARVLDKTLIRGIPLKDKGEKFIQAVRNFVRANRREIEENILSTLNIAKKAVPYFKTDYEVESVLGKSNSLLDSSLAFSVFSSVAMKKEPSRLATLEKSFIGSVFFRVCPMGTEGENTLGYYQQFTITASDMEDAKDWLREQGIDFRKVRQLEERRKAYERALDAVFMRKKGDITLGGSAKIDEDLDAHLEKLDAKYKVLDSEEWELYHTVLVDARTMPLEQQLENLSKMPMPKRTLEPTPEPTPEPDPFEEPPVEESSVVETPVLPAVPIPNPEIVEEPEAEEEVIPTPPDLTEKSVRRQQTDASQNDQFLAAIQEAFGEDADEVVVPEDTITAEEEKKGPSVEEVPLTVTLPPIPDRMVARPGEMRQIRNVRIVDRQKKMAVEPPKTEVPPTPTVEQPVWTAENRAIYELIYGSDEPVVEEEHHRQK